MNAFARPPVEEIVRFFEERFFNRTDKVAILAPWGKAAAVRPCGGLRDLLPAHVLGETAQKAIFAILEAQRVPILSATGLIDPSTATGKPLLDMVRSLAALEAQQVDRGSGR